MRELKIPPTLMDGLSALHSLDDAAFQEFVQIAGTSEQLASLVELTHALSKATASPPASIFSILNMLISLHELSQTESVLVEQLSKDVAVAFEKSVGSSPNNDTQKLQKRIETLLQSTENFAIYVKARSVLTDNQRTFLECRILSDIRAIYTGEPAITPAAAVILHSLKLVYWNNFQKEEFFVTLDTQDLKQLRSQLERAEKKTESLEELIGKAGISYVDLAEEQ